MCRAFRWRSLERFDTFTTTKKGGIRRSLGGFPNETTWTNEIRSGSAIQLYTLDGIFLGTTLPDVSHLHNDWRLFLPSSICRSFGQLLLKFVDFTCTLLTFLIQILKWTQYVGAWDIDKEAAQLLFKRHRFHVLQLAFPI